MSVKNNEAEVQGVHTHFLENPSLLSEKKEKMAV